MVLKWLLACLLFLPTFVSASIDAECEAALKTLFSEHVTKDQASNFLKVQGDITLHRLAWAYLKAQKSDQTEKLENVERTVLTLLDEKYTSTDPDFVKARDQFEAQPLSRTALAEIGPYLKEVLSKEFGAESQAFVLNSSDLKLLLALSKFEKEKATAGKFESRMLARKSPEGMLNFAKLINSSYKVTPNSTEEALDVEMRLQGLEKTIGNLQKQVNDFIKKLEAPTQCQPNKDCPEDNLDLASLFEQNEDIQNIFWESLSDKLGSDDLLLDNLTYGEIWLKTGPAPKAAPSPAVIQVTHNEKDEETAPQSTTHSKSTLKKSAAKSGPSHANTKPVTKTKVAGTTTTSVQSPVKAYYSSTGLYLDDPINVIVKDDPRRDPKSWRTFDPIFLGKMADAILNDDKVFEIDGKLYNRKNGKGMSPDDVLKLMPPKKSADSRAMLTNADPKFRAKQLAAMVNGDETFTMGPHVYAKDGHELNPAVTIAIEMSKKTGGKYTADRYKGMDVGFLVARADALKNNKPHFRVGARVFDSETGRSLTSPFRAMASTQDVKIQKQKRVQYQNLSDKETIINYHLDRTKKNGCQYYAIVDKKNADVTVYSLSGEKVFSKEVLIGVKASDVKTKWTEYNDVHHQGSYTTGAGAFKIAEPKKGAYYSKNFSNNILQIEGQNVFAIHQVPNGLSKRYQYFGTGDPADRRVSQGCVNMKQSDFLGLTKWMKPSCEVYVLPEEPNNKFAVKDGELKLVSKTLVPNSQDYNYPLNGPSYKKITIRISDGPGRTTQSLAFTKALEDEKEKMMKVFHLHNDDYNDLAGIAYGIMGNESSFGSSSKYWLKEHDQGDVIVAKAARQLWKGKNPFTRETINTSRGYTQIKELPNGDWKQAYPEVSKKTLNNPRNSAIATMAYLVEAVRTIKSIAQENGADPRKVKITKENIVDYLGYVYQGRKGALTSATDPANADFNTYVQGLRKNMAYIEISQKIE